MEHIIRNIIDDILVSKGINPEDINYTIEIPKKKDNGDFSSNVAFILSKILKKAPISIANELTSQINSDYFSKIEVAPPGFINFFFSKKVYFDFLSGYITDPYSNFENIGKAEKAMVEFVSANPTGPLHIGHGRGSAYGDTIARILKISGYDVYKEYYINDAGNQMNNLALSIYSRYCSFFGKNFPFPEDGYKGDYIIEIAKDIAVRFGDALINNEKDGIDTCFKIGVESITKGIEDDLKQFRVTFDNWFSEKSLYSNGDVENTIEKLFKNCEIYEKDGALWF
ncbi:MAG: arginine--tRNA ligase, partial [Calditerrivibrio sp.]|nr:arginine--tRNA ligase [Calditerrivibrio sp.]